MLSMKKIVILIVGLLSSVNIQAGSNFGFMPANKLYSLCTSEDAIAKGVCEGYIMAVNDAMLAGHLGHIFNVCFPSGVTPTQARLVVIKHMETIPEKLHYIADGVVAESLVATFPCKQKKAKSAKKTK